MNHLLAAGVVTLVVAFSAQAGDAFMTPKAKAQADSLKSVAATTHDKIDRSMQAGTSPKGREAAQSLRKVPSAGPGVDLAHAPRPLLSPRDPQFEPVLRANAAKQFEVAPLK